MKDLAIILLTLLTGGSYTDLELAERIQALLGEQMGAIEHLDVRITSRSPAQQMVGDWQEAIIELRGFEAALLPIEQLLPQPKERVLKGRVGRLLVDGRQARVADFTFSRLALEVTDLRLDLVGMLASHTIRITDYGSSRLEACLTRQELVRFVQHKLPLASQIEVDLQPGAPGAVKVQARVALGPLNLAIALTSGLQIVGGSRIELDHPRIESAGFALPAEMVQRALQSINPLLDLHTLLRSDAPLVLDRIEITKEEILLVGHLAFRFPSPALPKGEHYARLHRQLRYRQAQPWR